MRKVPREFQLDQSSALQGGGRPVGALGFVEIPDPFIAPRQLTVGLVGTRVPGQHILELFDGGILPAGGPRIARQRHLGRRHLGIDPARGLGLLLRLGQRFTDRRLDSRSATGPR